MLLLLLCLSQLGHHAVASYDAEILNATLIGASGRRVDDKHLTVLNRYYGKDPTYISVFVETNNLLDLLANSVLW